MTTIADDIWAILREVAEAQKKLKDRQEAFQKEVEDERKESQKESEDKRKESEDRRKEFEDSKKETDRILEELRAAQKATAISVGRLSNRLGEFVEEAVRPSAVRLFKARGLDVHEVYRNVSTKRNGEGLEIDLLIINDKDMVVIECKSNLSIDDVNEHLDRLEKVKRLMPRYKDNNISGAVAGMVIADNVAAYAIRKGLYVIAQNGEHLELRNDAVFVAKIW